MILQFKIGLVLKILLVKLCCFQCFSFGYLRFFKSVPMETCDLSMFFLRKTYCVQYVFNACAMRFQCFCQCFFRVISDMREHCCWQVFFEMEKRACQLQNSRFCLHNNTVLRENRSDHFGGATTSLVDPKRTKFVQNAPNSIPKAIVRVMLKSHRIDAFLIGLGTILAPTSKNKQKSMKSTKFSALASPLHNGPTTEEWGGGASA